MHDAVVVVADVGTTDGKDDLVRDTGADEATDEVDSNCSNIADDDNVFVRECSYCIEDIYIFGTVNDKDVELGTVQDNDIELGTFDDKDVHVELGTVQDNVVELGTVDDSDVEVDTVQDNNVELGTVKDNDVEVGTVQDNDEEIGVVLGNEEALGTGNSWSSDEACEHGQDETDVVAIEDDCKTERLAR